MNGFKLLSDSYKKLMNDGKISEEEARAEIRILDFLATCDSDDFCRLVDSGALNDIIKAYAEIAIEKGKVNDLFDWITAKEALKRQGYMGHMQ